MSNERSHDIDRRTVLKAVGAAGAAATLGGVAAATPGRNLGPKESEVLVGVSASAPDLVAAVEPHVPEGAEIVHDNETLGYVAVAFPQGADADRRAFLETVTDVPHVEYAEPNATYRVQYAPDDPYYADQYAPQQVDADDAWDTTLGHCNCPIAIVGQGTDCSHPDLCYCNAAGYDFVDDDGDPSPDDPSREYHGTHVTGIAAAKTDNGEGVAGVADASLLVARAFDGEGNGTASDIADAIVWAADQGAPVILLAFAGSAYSDTLKNAVSYAHDRDALLVGAAGNDYGGPVAYPAAFVEVLAVSAVDRNENLATFSNVGPEIALTAPGVDVLSTTTTVRGSYERLSGTSMSAAVVAGAAALGCARWNLTGGELYRHLTATATDLGLPPEEQGCGQVDAGAVVDTDPANSGTCGHADICGDRSSRGTVTDSLDGSLDSDCWSLSWEYGDPCRIVLELDGPADADFDLYANEGTGDCPTPLTYTHSSTSSDSNERIVIDDPDTSTPLYVLVYSYSGSGSYDLTIIEEAT